MSVTGTAPTANDLYRAAQALIKSGQPVFPCRARNEMVTIKGTEKLRKAKTPLTRSGLNDATRDKEQVKAWWRRYGDAAIGIPTGIVYDVLDVDTKGEYDGRVHLPRLTRLGLLNGCQKVVKTPSGGWHLYFRAAPGITNKAQATLGLDVRGLGGYVLAAPSYIDDEEESIGSYVEHDTPIEHTSEPLLWDLIVKTLAPINENTRQPIELLGYERSLSIVSLRGWLSERQHGERNNALHWAVSRCVDNGIDPYELMEVALMLGLGEDETSATMNSALKRAGLRRDDLYTEMEAMFGTD